jgi:hypothetical protein
MNQCLNCWHVAEDSDFTENLGCCPICNDETVVEMTAAEEAQHIAENSRCQNTYILHELAKRDKDRYKALRVEL